jgi:hypothetical protein
MLKKQIIYLTLLNVFELTHSYFMFIWILSGKVQINQLELEYENAS